MDATLEMGKRPSRQRRHLPTSVTSAVKTRLSTSTDERQHIALLNMSFRDSQSEPDMATSTAYQSSRSSVKNRAKQTREYKRKTQQFVAKSTVKTSNRKLVLKWISAFWILFIVYRVFISMKKEDFGNLSIVHFISKTVLQR
jgi:hypothetical protein